MSTGAAESRAIDVLFEELLKRGGSDLHLAVNQPPLARVRGEIVPIRETVLLAKELEEMLLELVTPVQRSEITSNLDLDLAVAYKDVARLRGSFFLKQGGIAATFRLVPGRVPSLAELGCPEVLWRLADRRGGLVIVASPASNGKTTTMAAMIDHINKTRACHVVTIESPLEFVHESLRAQITHREVGTHVPTFAAALRSAAAESADVVFVSELRTPEDAECALELAAKGVLVFTTSAASGATNAIGRLLAMFPAAAQPRVRRMLGEVLVGVVVQHLVRAVDSKPRVAIHEILVGTSQTLALVREGKLEGLNEAIRAGEAHGMQSLDAGLERLLGAGRIPPEVALERAVDKEAFARVIARMRPDLVEG
jgi:twitching motility protein PilT